MVTKLVSESDSKSVSYISYQGFSHLLLFDYNLFLLS